MGRFLVPCTILSAIAAFAVAAAITAVVPSQPGWWSAAIALVVLGGILPMIQAVSIRVVPVFARRTWPNEVWLGFQVGLFLAGAWVVLVGRLFSTTPLTVLGSFLVLLGGLLFTENTKRLIRQPVSSAPGPPLPSPAQTEVNELATRLTRLAGIYLLFGLMVGAVTSIWAPPVGRWDLVWAHVLLVGSFMPMAAGTSYHVLARWTGRRWSRLPLMRLHVRLVVVGLPLMILALAFDWLPLFAVAGTAEAGALLLFLAAIAPMLPGLSGLTRAGFSAAAVMLAVGLGLAIAFAVHPVAGARLRTVHAEVNIFGGAGLLVSGAGYYLFPRFAGRPLRWPRLAWFHLGLLAGGVALAAAGGFWRAAGGPIWPTIAGMSLVTTGFVIFATVIGGTFFAPPRKFGTVSSSLTIEPRGSGKRSPAQV